MKIPPVNLRIRAGTGGESERIIGGAGIGGGSLTSPSTASPNPSSPPAHKGAATTYKQGKT